MFTLRQTVIAFVLVTFGVGLGLALSGLPAYAQFEEPAPCAVPKAYGPFRGMIGNHFIFEDTQGTIRVVACVVTGPGVVITAEIRQMVPRDY